MEFAEYVEARRTGLVRAVVLLGCPLADAEDIVQTALLRAYRHWRKVERASQPDAYVYAIVLNTLRDARRRRWNGELPTADLPEIPIEQDATIGLAVRRALAGLSEDHRAVLVLRYYAGLSEQETARALRIAPGTVKSRTSRAIAALSADPNLAEEADDAPDAH
jgi:RNA polymerase sigma-70 factor (sigma-E family)